MDDLLTFLRDRLTEDEQAARAATAGPWEVDTECNEGGFLLRQTDGPAHVIYDPAPWEENGRDFEHFARHDPSRVLADVEAKRRIIELAEQVFNTAWSEKDDQGICFSHPIASRRMRDVLCLLALPFAGHPGYRPEWKP